MVQQTDRETRSRDKSFLERRETSFIERRDKSLMVNESNDFPNCKSHEFQWINKANKSFVTEPMSKNKYQIFSCGLTFTKAAISSLRGHSAQEPTTTKEITYHLLITINSPKGEVPLPTSVGDTQSLFSFLFSGGFQVDNQVAYSGRLPTSAGCPH